jgi:putative ABC transport system substrate-binding protein
LIEALRDLGYVEGQAVRLEVRSAENNLDRLPELAVALEHAKVDLIVAVSPPAIRAASQATKTIPIVMAFWGGEGLIESGIVTSFARSGTNVTGVYMFAAELDAKRLGPASDRGAGQAATDPGDVRMGRDGARWRVHGVWPSAC